MLDTPLLRPLEAEDLPAWLAIEHACFPDPWSEQQLSAQLKQTRNRCFGLFELNQLVGFAVFSTVLDEAELLQIAIAPGQQGKGLAAMLLSQSIDTLQQAEIIRFMLEVRASNDVAIRLYKKLGFNEDGRRKGYYPALDGREDAVLMSLTAEPNLT
ncbi:ribosomal protein S18-alanine N-acetyltransferase [Pontibacterium sp.]|uniref:ribosomal protein S18-alanine N-acetyltransferase n=1 Tax=Pontibacterium sp. TaxID=2036026 RepID=UPI003511AA34